MRISNFPFWDPLQSKDKIGTIGSRVMSVVESDLTIFKIFKDFFTKVLAFPSENLEYQSPAEHLHGPTGTKNDIRCDRLTELAGRRNSDFFQRQSNLQGSHFPYKRLDRKAFIQRIISRIATSVDHSWSKNLDRNTNSLKFSLIMGENSWQSAL